MFVLLDFKSFYSVWYWVLTVILWTAVCHRTLGVPHDMVLRARRVPEVAARVETLARLHAGRTAGLFDAAGVQVAALVGFGLAGLAALGFWSGLEAAKAAFMLAGPLALVLAGEVRLARRLRAERLSGAALLRQLARRRSVNQGIAALAMLGAAVAAVGHAPVGLGF